MFALALAGCAGSTTSTVEEAESDGIAVALSFGTSGRAVAARTLNAGDTVTIAISGGYEASGSTTVGADGTARFRFTGVPVGVVITGTATVERDGVTLFSGTSEPTTVQQSGTVIRITLAEQYYGKIDGTVHYTKDDLLVAIGDASGSITIQLGPLVENADLESSSVVGTVGDVIESNSSLTTVSLDMSEASSVTSIGQDAFARTSLASVTIPSSMTSIGVNAFKGCTSLASVTIPSSVTSIGEWAFSCCTSLASVTIPSSVTRIGEYAFERCNSLASVTIPSSVTSIGEYAFERCNSLASVTIPSSVTRIGEYAFERCNSLASVTFENPNGWKAGTFDLSADDNLRIPATAATYLNLTYLAQTWTRE